MCANSRAATLKERMAERRIDSALWDGNRGLRRGAASEREDQNRLSGPNVARAEGTNCFAARIFMARLAGNARTNESANRQRNRRSG